MAQRWSVGFEDRGHGHGDYGVLAKDGTVVAEVRTGLLEDAKLLASAPALKEVVEAIMEASLFWTGEDEEKNPALKRARTLAGLVLRPLEPDPSET